MKVYVLMLVEPDGCHIYSSHSSRKSALKAGLKLIRDNVADALDFYRKTGDESAEWVYRNPYNFGGDLCYMFIREDVILD